MGRMSTPRRSYGVSLGLVALVLLTPGCRRGQDDTVLKLSHITAPGSTWDRGAKAFADFLEASTAGADGPALRVRVFPGGRLAFGKQETELQMVRSGAIDMAIVSTIILGLYLDKRYDAFSLPWLVHDHDQARALCDGAFGTAALSWLESYDLVGLAWGVNGFRQVTNSKRPVRVPDDLAGLKIRVAGSDIFRDIFGCFGAQPLTMNFGELMTSLEQGVVDGQENPLSIIDSSRLYECQDHVTIWNYVYDPLILVINAERWKRLSPIQQGLLRDAAKQAMDRQRQLVEQDDHTLPVELAKQGMEIVALSKSQRAAFQAKARPIYERYRSRIGTEVVDRIIQAAREAEASTGRSAGKPSGRAATGAQ